MFSLFSEKIPCNVKVCSNGCVHIQLASVTINLHKDDFIEFSSVIAKVSREIASPPSNVRSLAKFRLLGKREPH